MLLVLSLLLVGITASDYENCDSIIRLKKREVGQLLSPNHPYKAPANSTCRWTVLADVYRRIVLVCPFNQTLDIHARDYEESCNGKFTISPEGGEETYYCRERGFYEFGFSNRMVITYENQLNQAVDGFSCHVYAEWTKRWDQPEEYNANRRFASHQRQLPKPKIWQLSSSGIELILNLGRNDVKALVPPSDPESEEGLSKRSWYVRAGFSNQITVACSYTDQPPAPLTIQVVPCYGRFTVLTKERNETYHCHQKAFTQSTLYSYQPNVSMIIKYESSEGRPADNFACNVYSEGKPILIKENPYKNCDHVFNLTRNADSALLESPNYPAATLPGSQCRWTVVAPEESQIKIKCPKPLGSENIKCIGDFVVKTAGNEDKHCLNTTYVRVTSNNWTMITYHNLYNLSVVPFMCQASLIHNSSMDTAAVSFKNEQCDHVILLRYREMKPVLSPNYPDEEPRGSTCRWNVLTPFESRIILACIHPGTPGKNTSTELPCSGLITVSTEDRSATVHCSDRTFSRTSASNRMIFMYENLLEKTQKPFSCFVYTDDELQRNEHNLTVEEALVNQNGEQNISLSINEKMELRPPNYRVPARSIFSWTVVAPTGSRILLSCPSPKKDWPTKQPNEEKLCYTYFTVSTEGLPKLTYCRDLPFMRSSLNNIMVITYENLSDGPAGGFLCNLYAELESPINECENCTEALPYTECDNIFNLTLNEMRGLQLPNHMENDTPGTSCRWTLVAPPNFQVFLFCPYNSRINGTSCNSKFTVVTAGNETHYCRNQDIAQFSNTNWMIATYENPSFDTFSLFECFAYVEKKWLSDGSDDYTVIQGQQTIMWTQNIPLNDVGQSKTLASPNYPDDIPPGVPCRWTVTSPVITFISMKCTDLEDENEDEPCKGFFAIYGTGPGKNATILCRHKAITIRSTGNEMILTYGNQFGVSRKPFECSVTAVDTQCHRTFTLPRLPYNDYINLRTPYWESKDPPWPSCDWSLETPEYTQIYLLCKVQKESETLMISSTGDNDVTNATIRLRNTSFIEVSIRNRMTIQYNVTETSKPKTDIGCGVFVDRAPPLGEECNCGNKFKKIKGRSNTRRIRNGQKTLPNEFPMMAAILERGFLELICGATIISDRYAITAAHCFIHHILWKTQLGLFVGERTRSKAVRGEHIYIINFLKYHPQFNSETNSCDFGIVGVKTPIRFNDHSIGRVCLPFYNRKESFTGEHVIVLGWGHTHEYNFFWDGFFGPTSDDLLKIDGFVIPDRQCLNPWNYQKFHKQWLCIRYINKNPCPGDSGGPVLWRDPITGLLKLIGTTVGGLGCNSTGTQSLSMEIPYFLDWIEKELPNVTFCKAE